MSAGSPCRSGRAGPNQVCDKDLSQTSSLQVAFRRLLAPRPSTAAAMPLFGGGKSELQKAYNYDTKKDKLGEGNFAEVFKATLSKPRTAEKLGEPIPDTVAIKVIDKAKVEDMNDITREIEIMQAVGHHPNIICLFEVFDEKKTVNLVMELVTGGELFDMIVQRGNYTEKDAANTVVTLCDALGFLHSKNVVHRDLKPENILIESPNSDKIKIADFGLARTCGGGEVMKTACGTPGYVAPEILKNKGYDSPAVDMWSVGVILYILLCGFPPFYEEELPVRARTAAASTSARSTTAASKASNTPQHTLSLTLQPHLLPSFPHTHRPSSRRSSTPSMISPLPGGTPSHPARWSSSRSSLPSTRQSA